MPLDPDRKIIQIAVSAAPGNVPVGLEVGELGVDLANPPRLWIGVPPGIDASELLRLPLASYAPSITWTEGTDPGNVSMFINNTGRRLTITAIWGVVEALNGNAADVSVVKADEGVALAAGIDVHTNVPFDADRPPAGEIQRLDLTADAYLLPGWRLGLLSSSAGGWNNSVASITVYLE